MSVSNAAYVFICPCAKMPPPREQEEDYSYSDNTDYDDVEHDDDDKSSGDEWSRTSSSEDYTNSQDESCETTRPSVKFKSMWKTEAEHFQLDNAHNSRDFVMCLCDIKKIH